MAQNPGVGVGLNTTTTDKLLKESANQQGQGGQLRPRLAIAAMSLLS